MRPDIIQLQSNPVPFFANYSLNIVKPKRVERENNYADMKL